LLLLFAAMQRRNKQKQRLIFFAALLYVALRCKAKRKRSLAEKKLKISSSIKTTLFLQKINPILVVIKDNNLLIKFN
jgi:hypothetical protein